MARGEKVFEMESPDGLLSSLGLCYIQPANAGKFHEIVCLIIFRYTLLRDFLAGFKHELMSVSIGSVG